MKTCVYLDDPKVAAAIKEERYNDTKEDIGVLFDKIDSKLDLKHDDLARAMFIAKACGKDGDLKNVRTLLDDASDEAILRQAYKDGEIGREYLERWMTEDEIEAITPKTDAE